MFKACTAQQMRAMDQNAINEAGIPGIILMENAALRCVEELESDFISLKDLKIGVFCGKGNNGGDGFAIARHLVRLGASVSVYLVCGSDFSGDALINYEMLENVNCRITEDFTCLDLELQTFDIVVDAIFGTGINGEIHGTAFDVIECINSNSSYVLSVDVPSGIDSNSGNVPGICVKADKTVTFAAYKLGMLCYPAADFTGEIKAVDICIPENVHDNIRCFVTDRDFIKKHFPSRTDNSQKSDYGKILIIAGSSGMTGAAYMASQAALYSGSGIVTLAVCDELMNILEEKTTEVMTIGLASENGHLSSLCIPQLAEILPGYDAVLFGPGLGRHKDIEEILSELVKICSVPLIIDADGLFALSKNKAMLNECNCSVILTPHEMEMSRLIDSDLDYIINNRFEASSAFAEENGVTLILKGHHTIVTSPDGSQYINTTGNSGMATGGSGDILAGITASLAARCTEEYKACAMSVFIHGAAGDAANDEFGAEGVSAMRICQKLSQTIKEILR